MGSKYLTVIRNENIDYRTFRDKHTQKSITHIAPVTLV